MLDTLALMCHTLITPGNAEAATMNAATVRTTTARILASPADAAAKSVIAPGRKSVSIPAGSTIRESGESVYAGMIQIRVENVTGLWNIADHAWSNTIKAD